VKATIGIEIEAPPRLVFELARDVERWPALLPHYLRVTVRERHPDGRRTADMVAVRALVRRLGLGIPVAWRATTWAEPSTLRLRFRHVAGATRGMDVTWRIEPTARGCRVEIEHDFRPRFGPWAIVVDRLFVRPIAGRTLATFKSIAEAVSATERSEPAGAPKSST
jgi:ribosome-associated toxin RatA of RatAB toxin-antitoxin module